MGLRNSYSNSASILLLGLFPSGSSSGESESHSVVSDSLRPHGLYSPWNSPGQNTGVGSLSLLQMIFPTQGSNLGLPHCRWILYQLSHKGSPRILEWEPIPSPVDLPTQELNQGLLNCRRIPYQLSYQGSPSRSETPLIPLRGVGMMLWVSETESGKVVLTRPEFLF